MTNEQRRLVLAPLCLYILPLPKTLGLGTAISYIIFHFRSVIDDSAIFPDTLRFHLSV